MVDAILGRKLGMTQVFGENGDVVPVTVLKAGPCVVIQRKSAEKDGYDAAQLGLVELPPPRHVNKAIEGHFKRAAAIPARFLREVPLAAGGAEVKVGDKVLVDQFKVDELVDITGVSKGRGFAGVQKRHHFRGGGAAHGSMFHRAPGSIGASAYPSRVLKGMRAAGHMGVDRVTVRNLRVVQVLPEDDTLLVQGAVPGPNGGYVVVRKAKAPHKKDGRQKAVSRGQSDTMATVEVRNLEGQTVKELQLADEIFAAPPNQSLLWEAVKSYLASQRRGTHSTKSRGEVSGSGKKPWRQKGTGRARVGSIRSSLWRHGSIAHGPKPRDYAYKIPEKMLRGALRSALAAKFQENKLTVVDRLDLPEGKTKLFAAILRKLDLGRTVLVVNEAGNRNLELSSRNLRGCDLVRHHDVHPYHVLSHDRLLISEGALTRLQEALR